MNNASSSRIAESLSRHEGAAFEDFETRTAAAKDLGASLEELVRLHIEGEERWGPDVSTDGVIADVVSRTGPNQFDLDGRLWLLAGRDSWAEPFSATLELSDDGSAVNRYELKCGDAALGFDPKLEQPIPPPDGHWLFAFRSQVVE